MPLDTPLLDLHRSARAEIGEYFGSWLPARFADLSSEYAAARNAVALADTNFKAYFSFSGPDAQRYVNAVLTSNVRDLKAGQGAVGLLLNPQGHILAEVETYMRDGSILASCHSMVRERTFATFDKFIIMDDVTLEDVTPQTGNLDILGARAGALVSDMSGMDVTELPTLAHREITLDSIPCRIARHDWGNVFGVRFIVAREHLAPLWRDLEARVRDHDGVPVGLEALNSIRLEFGMPWFGLDYDDKNIPHEAGLENSHISYEKGCYTGQEIVERVRSRGHVNRRLTSLQFEANVPPAPGAKLLAPGNAGAMEIGYVTSVGYSPSRDRPIGLGYVRREHSAVGTRLDASGTAAEVISPQISA